MYQSTWCTMDDVMSDLLMPYGSARGENQRIDKNFIVVGEGPPPNIRTEDTEKEYIDVDIAPPDLSLIKQMLHIAKENYQETSENINQQPDQCVITKIKEPTAKIITEPTIKLKKEKLCRNVALQSLLLKLEKSQAGLDDECTNMIPMDIIDDSSVSCDKISNKIDNNLASKQRNVLNPIMFRRKIKPHTPEKRVIDTSSSTSSSSVPSPSCVPTYVPSAYAAVKYNEFMERNALRAKLVTENNNLDETYTKLKQIEALRVEPDINKHPGLTEDEYNRLKPVLLPAHRHQIDEDCSLCIMKAEIGANIPISKLL